MAADAGVGARVDAVADVAVEVVALFGIERDVAGEGVEEVDVLFRRVHQFPDVAARLEVAEEAGDFDLFSHVGNVCWERPFDDLVLADGLVDLLDVAEERVGVFREGVAAADDRERAARLE